MLSRAGSNSCDISEMSFIEVVVALPGPTVVAGAPGVAAYIALSLVPVLVPVFAGELVAATPHPQARRPRAVCPACVGAEARCDVA